MKKNKMGEAFSTLGDGRSAYRVLEGKNWGKETTWKHKHGREDNIQELGLGDKDWIDLAQDRERWQALVKVVMNLWVS